MEKQEYQEQINQKKEQIQQINDRIEQLGNQKQQLIGQINLLAQQAQGEGFQVDQQGNITKKGKESLSKPKKVSSGGEE